MNSKKYRKNMEECIHSSEDKINKCWGCKNPTLVKLNCGDNKKQFPIFTDGTECNECKYHEIEEEE